MGADLKSVPTPTASGNLFQHRCQFFALLVSERRFAQFPDFCRCVGLVAQDFKRIHNAVEICLASFVGVTVALYQALAFGDFHGKVIINGYAVQYRRQPFVDGGGFRFITQGANGA